MNRANRFVLALLTAGALVLGGRSALAGSAASRPATASPVKPPIQLHVDTSALAPLPDFKLPSLSGKMHSLADYRGKVLVLTFWSVGCSPCRVEVPPFIELQKAYGEQGLRIVGIAVEGADKADLELFAKAKSINYDVLLGTLEVEKAFGGIKDTPTTFVVTQDGKIYQKHVGLKLRDVFESDIKTLLGIAP